MHQRFWSPFRGARQRGQSVLPKGTIAAASRFEPGTSRLRVHGLIHGTTAAEVELWLRIIRFAPVLCDSSRDSDSSPFYSDSDSSPVFSLWLGLRNRDSWLGPESRPSPSSSGRAVLRCLLWHSIHFVVCFHVLEDKQNNVEYVGYYIRDSDSIFFLTRTHGLGLELGLWCNDSDLDSDFEVMTRTRIWQPGLGHSTDLQ